MKNGQELVIREAQVEDAQSILNYIESISGESNFLTFGPGDFEHSLQDEEALLAKILETDNALFIVGTIDAKIASVLVFNAGQRPRVRHRGEFSMSVSRDYWGQGIGSLMLDALIDWAKAGNIIRKIDLMVRTDNERAIRLYEGKGFLFEGTLHKEFFVDGRYYDLHWMGLEL
jgi:RimJ/RimL family protein N-acetyltransferase